MNENSVVKLKNSIIKMKNSFFVPVLELVEVLSKNELIEMDESLIKITALKRKFDSELETVGVNINVAIITKGERFVYKK